MNISQIPWSILEFRLLLSICAVNFKFQKKDGTVTNVVGTTNPKFIPVTALTANYDPVSRAIMDNDKVVMYYDLEKQDWRNMSIDCESIVLQTWKTLPAKYR